MAQVLVSQWIYFPDWLTPDDEALEQGIDFCVCVNWEGEGRYSITKGLSRMWFLSRAGNWAARPQPYRRAQYRFTSEEAHEWASKIVVNLRVNGRTHDEWVAHFRSMDREANKPPK